MEEPKKPISSVCVPSDEAERAWCVEQRRSGAAFAEDGLLGQVGGRAGRRPFLLFACTNSLAEPLLDQVYTTEMHRGDPPNSSRDEPAQKARRTRLRGEARAGR